MKRLIILCMLICTLIFALAGCTAHETDVVGVLVEITSDTDISSEESDDIFEGTGIPKFELTSEDLLEDGSWKEVIGKKRGENVSPQLSWEAVEGAQSYVIIMVDGEAWNWVHWKANNVTQTNLPQGFAEGKKEYVGPYPPSGVTHDYGVYVIALKEPVERVKVGLDAINPNFTKNTLSLDGESGNILGYGYIAGTYSN